MNTFRKEYFDDNYYFLIEGVGEDYTLSYSSYNVISETKKEENKKHFKKKDLKKVENKVQSLLKRKKKPTKQELDELVDEDGTLNSSRIPILNKWLTPKKTMDMTVVAARISNDPVTRGYRVYYGESENKEGKVIDEIDLSDAFGFKETKDKDFKETVRTFKKMGIEDPEERVDRAKQLGKIRGVKKTKGKLKQRLTEKEIEEEKKNLMAKMVEDIVTKKNSKSNGDIIEKDDSLSKILMKNLESIKKLAEKEGISLNKLINVLKKGE
jgi:hypothetical protein